MHIAHDKQKCKKLLRKKTIYLLLYRCTLFIMRRAHLLLHRCSRCWVNQDGDGDACGARGISYHD